MIARIAYSDPVAPEVAAARRDNLVRRFRPALARQPGRLGATGWSMRPAATSRSRFGTRGTLWMPAAAPPMRRRSYPASARSWPTRFQAPPPDRLTSGQPAVTVVLDGPSPRATSTRWIAPDGLGRSVLCLAVRAFCQARNAQGPYRGGGPEQGGPAPWPRLAAYPRHWSTRVPFLADPCRQLRRKRGDPRDWDLAVD